MIAASQRSMVMIASSRIVAEADISERRRQQPHDHPQPKQIVHQHFLELALLRRTQGDGKSYSRASRSAWRSNARQRASAAHMFFVDFLCFAAQQTRLPITHYCGGGMHAVHASANRPAIPCPVYRAEARDLIEKRRSAPRSLPSAAHADGCGGYRRPHGQPSSRRRWRNHSR